MGDEPPTAIYRKIGDKYQIEISGQPTGFTSDLEVLYHQLEHLQKQGFTLAEDKKNQINLDDRV